MTTFKAEAHNPADNDDRGRSAESPAEIPKPGWKDIAVRVYNGMQEDSIVAIAGGVTFFLLLAIFPGVAGLISLYGIFADPSTIEKHLDMLTGVIPQGGMQVITDQVHALISQPRKSVGFAMLAGLAVSIWSANGGVKAMFDALNVVYREKEKRGFFKLNFVSLTATLAFIAFMLFALAGITLLPLILDYLGLTETLGFLLRVGRWPLLIVGVGLAIAVLYRFGPSRDKPRWRWVSPGSAFAAIGFLVASLLFSFYTEHFGSYNKTYGSLGAIIGFMTWMWISCIVVLLGAKLNAETEHQTARDSTDGASKPLGERGAHVADSVGSAA